MPFRSPAPALLAAPFLAVAAVAAPAVAYAADPAAQQVDVLNDGLQSIMKAGGTAESRFRRIQPVIDRVFDTTAMARVAVGPPWNGFSPADQAAVSRAFSRFTAATYASNFDNFDGERFTTDPNVQTRGPDKLVKSQLITKGGATLFTYRMRQSGGAWKIIDVFFNGTISQIAAQRSQFTGALAGGAPSLIKSLDDKTATLLKN